MPGGYTNPDDALLADYLGGPAAVVYDDTAGFPGPRAGGPDDPDRYVIEDYPFTTAVAAGTTETYPILVYAHLAGLHPTGSAALDPTPWTVFFDVMTPHWVYPTVFVDPDQTVIFDYS